MQPNKNTSETDKNRDVFDDDTMRRILRETAEEVKPANPAVFSRINRAIGYPEKTAGSRWSFMNRLRDFFAIPQLAWGFAAIQTIVLCLFLVNSPQKQQTYEVLSASQVETTFSQPSFHVIFNNTAQMADIESLLQKTGAIITDGPEKRGIYTMRFKKRQTDNVENRLEILRQSSLINFIEQAY